MSAITPFFVYLLPDDVRTRPGLDLDVDNEYCVAMLMERRDPGDLSEPAPERGEPGGFTQTGQAESDGQDWRDTAIDHCQFVCASEGIPEFRIWDGAERTWTLFQFDPGDERWVATDVDLADIPRNLPGAGPAWVRVEVANTLVEYALKELNRAANVLEAAVGRFPPEFLSAEEALTAASDRLTELAVYNDPGNRVEERTLTDDDREAMVDRLVNADLDSNSAKDLAREFLWPRYEAMSDSELSEVHAECIEAYGEE